MTGQDLPVEGERCLLPLVLRVEVGNPMLLIEHPDQDAEKGRNDWHAVVYSRFRRRFNDLAVQRRRAAPSAASG
jgi:hypothetical protein